MSTKVTRRNVLKTAGAVAGTGAVVTLRSRGFAAPRSGMYTVTVGAQDATEEYVWLSANSNLPLFVAHDHPALDQIGKELGVKVTIAGPNTVDIPGLVSAVEQTAARRPAGMMVVGWDPAALVPAIDAAVEAGIPVVTVDADVPASRRLSFIGTEWFDLGVRQGQAMVQALEGKQGKVALLGLVALDNMQRGFAGFRSIVEPAGFEVLEEQEDKGNQAEAARVAAGLIQGTSGLIGIAGFDSESGPGIGQALKESEKAGKIAATCVDAEEQHLRLVQEGVLSAAVGQKRELFTYQGVKALYDIVHNTLQFTSDDVKAGVVPIPINYNTGTYTVNADNVALFLG